MVGGMAGVSMPSLYLVSSDDTMDPFTHVSEKRSLGLPTHPLTPGLRGSTAGWIETMSHIVHHIMADIFRSDTRRGMLRHARFGRSGSPSSRSQSMQTGKACATFRRRSAYRRPQFHWPASQSIPVCRKLAVGGRVKRTSAAIPIDHPQVPPNINPQDSMTAT